MTEMVFAIDLETTGLYADRGDKILEVAAVPVSGGRVVREGAFERLVNPAMPIPPEATRIHGITDDMVRDAPPIERVLPELLKIVGGSPLLAHNAPFDIGFLRHYALLLGLQAPANRIIDTRDMSRRLFPGHGSHSLDALALRLGVRKPDGKRHRSLADACIAAECYLAMHSLYR